MLCIIPLHILIYYPPYFSIINGNGSSLLVLNVSQSYHEDSFQDHCLVFLVDAASPDRSTELPRLLNAVDVERGHLMGEYIMCKTCRMPKHCQPDYCGMPMILIWLI